MRGLRDIPMERVQFLTVPRESYAYDANRDQLVEPQAERLFERLRTDTPVAVAGDDPRGSAPPRPTDSRDGSYGDSYPGPFAKPVVTVSPPPTFRDTAAEDTCE
ncbi:LCP family protein required for cell wall assembly OS=Streptomyces violarus OX=67380 GN=FHS41_006915 PE=3 SV=1 [Streptomyces violarus]